MLLLGMRLSSHSLVNMYFIFTLLVTTLLMFLFRECFPLRLRCFIHVVSQGWTS
uniref:Uncharacterized protein n=1 Tax=Anguilla anguilla TaxID=7936 RepID=A0A0E9QDI0_ANGAN